MKNIDNSFVSLNSFKEAKGFIIIFTCNHCPFAKAYEDRIITLDNMFKPQGYPVIAINPNDDTAYNNRGHSKYELKDYKGAILDFTTAISINPNNDSAYNNPSELGDRYSYYLLSVKHFFLVDFI